MAQYLLFETRGTRYALEAAAVLTTFWLPVPAPVEDLPPHFIGLLNLHGRVVPLIDLAVRFGHGPAALVPTQSVVLLQGPAGGQDLGLLADRILDLTDVPDQALGDYVHLEGVAHPPHEGLIAGSLRWDDQVLILLDVGVLRRLLLQYPPDAAADALPPATGAERFVALDAATAARLHERTRQLAAVPAADVQATQRYALVTIGDTRFALPLNQVREFGHLGTCVPLPCTPPHILGCINLRGSILAVIDAGPLVKGAPQPGYAVVVVLQLGDAQVGLAVHAVQDIRAYPAAAVTALTGQAYGHQHCHALIHDADGVAGVLDLEMLWRDGLLEVDAAL